MAFSKVTLNGETLMDVTDDTVAANNMLYGTRGTAANGTTVTGAVVTTPVDSTLDTTSHNAIENAAVASALALKADSSSIPSATSDLTNDSNFVADANYVHTDNNFTTTLKNKLDGIAEGATVDDHKWNGVSLTANTTNSAADQYIPQLTSKSATTGSAGLLELTETPTAYKAVKYDSNAYLKSTTPASGDSSTKVATTAFVSSAISSLGSVLNYKGTKATTSALPTTGNKTGDVWIVTADNSEWVWDGSDWEELGPTIDLSGYVPTTRTVNGKTLSTDITLSASDVGALPSDTSYVSSFNGNTGAVTFSEIDPIFSASAAAGISSSDITSWNAKLDTYYGTCSTAKATVQKEVSIPNVTSLTTGLTVFVKFTNSNTIADPTLKINTLDPVAIKRYGTTAPSTSAASSWNAGAVIALTYDGTNFIMNDWNNTTYSAMTETEMQTGTSTTSRLITPARLKAAVEYHAPVTSVNGATGAVSITIPSATSDLTNDSGFITTETDPVFGASAAATITSSDITNWNSKSSSDTKVTQSPSSSNLDLPIILRNNTESTSSTTEEVRFVSTVTVQPSNGNLKATTFNGYTLAAASAKGVDTSISAASSSANLPTSAAVASFVEGKGYLTSYTETDPTVPAWAKAESKPTYTFSELTSHPTSISGYGITDAYTKTEVDGKVSGVLHYKGTKATVSALPSSGNTTGDVWHVTADGSEWAWDGTEWQELGTAVDLSGYVPTTRTVNGKTLAADISLTASDVDAVSLSGDTMFGQLILDYNLTAEDGLRLNCDRNSYVTLKSYGYSGTAPGAYTPILTFSSGSTDAVKQVYLRGVATPSLSTDAANKAYVDSAVSSLTPVVAYTTTLAAANWSNTTPSTYTYSNTSITCGASGDVPPLITCTSNETEYSTITSASTTPGTGITFTAPSAPAGAIGLVIIDYK